MRRRRIDRQELRRKLIASDRFLYTAGLLGIAVLVVGVLYLLSSCEAQLLVPTTN